MPEHGEIRCVIWSVHYLYFPVCLALDSLYTVCMVSAYALQILVNSSRQIIFASDKQDFAEAAGAAAASLQTQLKPLS